MKSSTVRGTPVRFIGPAGSGVIGGGHEGFRQGSHLPGMSGTVNRQFEGDQSSQPNARSGTPYQDREGNPDEFKRVASHGPKGGVVISENGLNHNDPASTGAGVILASQGPGHMNNPAGAPAMDSPVPAHAPQFQTEAMVAENRAHLGTGNEIATGTLLEVGGVMSRGMDSTSKPSGGEGELLEDDDLRNLGAGGAVG